MIVEAAGWQSDHVSVEDMWGLLIQGGRTHGPDLLAAAWDGGKLDRDGLAATIGGVWSGAEFPEQSLPHRQWREMFRAAGRPGVSSIQLPTMLYRGSVWDRRRGWSWTNSRSTAERFASGVGTGGYLGRLPGHVYEVAPPRHALLCVIESDDNRGEDEYVIDTRFLTITQAAWSAGTSCACPLPECPTSATSTTSLSTQPKEEQ